MSYLNDWKDLISVFGYGFVDDIAQYEHIVKTWAYTDMQPRTIDGLGEFRGDVKNRRALEKVFNELASKLFSFVISESAKSEKDFDDWHKKLCENFCKDFNGKTKGFQVQTIGFGKAQKIVNVSLKYIYCLKGADKYIEKFEHCHMVLDRYTYSEGFYKQKVIPSLNLKKSGLTSWSNLEFGEYEVIQQNIRKFMKTQKEYIDAHGKPLTPFQAEFYIFNEYNQ